MTAIELRFPANRFHATPWGRHVNEGVPEWPPSPYRLLRALYDVWKRKHPDLPEASVASVFEALAAQPPRFRLPETTMSHTRAYLSSNTEDPTDKSLIFDAFIALNPEALDPGAKCYVVWPSADLNVEQRIVLEELLRSLNFLGRSESWIDARISAPPEAGCWCDPVHLAEGSGDLIPVACAKPVEDYKGKTSWMTALAYSTGDFMKERRNAPPAMQMVQYVRPEMRAPLRPLKRPHQNIQAIRLALDCPVLPLVTATIEVAEQIRTKLMGIHKRLMNNPAMVSAKFSGKTGDGKPRTDHQHLFILPRADMRGRIYQVLLYTRDPAGFRPDEVRAILQLHSLWQRDGRPDVHCVATWKGSATDSGFRPLSTAVESETPFVSARHWRKGRGEWLDFIGQEIRRECRNHSLPEPFHVEPMQEAPGPFDWVEYRRNRKGDPPRAGYGFRLEFDEPVQAPLSLGYACHFGLGQFNAAK